MKKLVKIINFVFSLSLLVSLNFSFIRPAYGDVLSKRLEDITAAQNQGDLISAVLGVAVPVAIMALVGLSAYAGFLMLTSQGNPEKLAEAKEVISNALTGFGLIALSVALLLVIQSVLKIPGVNP